jgi:polyisoprenoid-binding protein YceI
VKGGLSSAKAQNTRIGKPKENNMNKRIIIGIGVIVVLVIVGAAAYVLRPTPEASAPLEAIPVDVGSSESQTMDESKPADNQDMAGESPAENVSQSPQGTLVFVIVQDQSEVRFTLNEILRGNPTTVIGATDQVAGQIAVDFENPSNSKVGAILINARTFKTDNDFRNRAINNEILDTGTYELITFTPTSIIGFPENPKLGEPISFQLTGDLTIRNITNPVTFDMIVTAVTENQLVGYGSTMVARADYGLKIPNVPNVADVDEEVLLEIEFVASAAQ